MSWNFLQRIVNYNTSVYTDIEMNDSVIDITDYKIYKYPELDLKHSDDDRSTLSVNTPDITEPSSTPELKVEQNSNENLKLYTEIKKICILHKLEQINQEIKLRDDYIKKYYGNTIGGVKFDKPDEYKPTKLEIMEIKLTLMGWYCLGLTAALIFL